MNMTAAPEDQAASVNWTNRKNLILAAVALGGIITLGMGLSLAYWLYAQNTQIYTISRSSLNMQISRSVNRPQMPPSKTDLDFVSDADSLKNTPSNIPVLTYHYIETTPADQVRNTTAQGLRVAPDVFERQLQMLQKEGYTTLSIDDYRQIVVGAKQRPAKPIMLTFDDGYKNNYEFAFPLLKKYGMVGNFALITGVMGQMDYMSWDNAKEMSLAGMGIMSHTVWHCQLAQKKKDNGKTVYLTNPPDTTEKQCNSFTYAGSLTVGQVRYELRHSKQELEDKLGKKIISFVYPYGAFNDQTIEETQSAGYELAFTTLGNIPPGAEHPNLLVPRIDIHGQQSGPLNGFFGDIPYHKSPR